jgi:pimeloyl-ACP methyl ester carboxylesterase
MVPGIEHRTFESFDGTSIAYQVRGQGPCIVLSNGLGGTFEAFRHVYAALGERYRILCWDYRGLYRSGRPRDTRTLAIPYHCHDLELLLAREGIDRALFVGWSMGVQVNFEFFRLHRERVAGLVAINGTYGSPFRSAMASRLTRHVIPHALTAMKARAAFFSAASRRAVAWPGLVPMMQRLGLVSPHLDVDAMYDVAADFMTLDWSLYSDQLRYLGDHDAREVLPLVDVPTLIITGDRDVMTPVFTARRMNQRIAGSRLVVIEGGTHYTPIEYPGVIQDELVRFLGGISGYGAGETIPGAGSSSPTSAQ